jgi:hypothetical protein
MTEQEWLAEHSFPQSMVWELLRPGKVQRTRAGKRKLRLFACGCCRLVWGLLADPRSRMAVEVAEQYADAQIDREVLRASFEQNAELVRRSFPPSSPGFEPGVGVLMALASVEARAGDAAFEITYYQPVLAGHSGFDRSWDARLCHLLRCVFGNPFRPTALDPAWRTPTLSALGRIVYEDRAFERLPILADALEETGCTDAALLDHCRQPGEHVRGCWVVDLLLGKQ